MKNWNIYILLLLLLAGCAADEHPIPTPGPGLPENQTTIRIKFTYSDFPNSYAIDLQKENQIDTLELFAFTSGGGALLNDKFAYRISIPGEDITDVGNGREKIVKVTLKSMEQQQRIALVANIPLGKTIVATEGETTMKQIVDQLTFDGATWYPDVSGKVEKTNFPMWGQNHTFYKIHHSETPPSSIGINMIRSVAKIEIGVDLDNPDPSLGFGSLFKIKNIYVCNASREGMITPGDALLNSTNANDTISTNVNLVSPYVRSADLKYSYTDGERYLRNTIYIPESGINGSVDADYKPAFLVVEATYQEHSDPLKTYFYRVDFTDKANYIAILRNHSYLVNITGIRTEGYSSLTEAKEAPISNLGLLVLSNEGEASSKIKNIETNGDYYLGVSSDNVKIDWYTQVAKVYVMTSYSKGWEAENVSNISGFLRDKPNSGRETVLDSVLFNVSDNTTGIPKVYKLKVKAGFLTKEITVTQSPGSNSYIVTGDKNIQKAMKIPVLSANTGGELRMTSGEILRATGVLWAESSIGSNITTSHNPSTDIIDVTGITGEGNVVIYAVTNSCQLFTWHLWVTENDPTIVQRSHNGFIFMDRNLGAVGTTLPEKGGVFYQWGRKDPFSKKTRNITYELNPAPPGNCSLGNANVIGGGPLDEGNFLDDAILLPKNFFMRETPPFDWAASGVQYQNNSYWNSINGEKGPYDPCPFGWRVPIAEAWKGFSGSSTNGIKLEVAGYLDMITGDHVNSGFSVWGASPKGTSAYLFEGADSQSFRANGYPVRCVKDAE